MILKSDLTTQKYTYIKHEDDYKFNAPHHFQVLTNETDSTGKVLAEINFQEGAIKEHGVNGVMNEDLIAMVIRRIEGFQNSEFNCRENALALTKLEEALMWLRKRTQGRENRGVEGTYVV
jgi:predicted deacetylase